MLPFIVIGAIAAVVLFVRPNPPIKAIDLDDWSFELGGRVGTVKRRTGESSSSSSKTTHRMRMAATMKPVQSRMNVPHNFFSDGGLSF